MRVGDVVGLVGPLGAGKTTLAQGIAQGLEVPPDRHVASPTFALVNEHPGSRPASSTRTSIAWPIRPS